MLAATLCALVAATTRATALPVRGTRPAFTAELPDDFVQLPADAPGTFLFARGRLERVFIVVSLRPLRGPIANDPWDARESRQVIQTISPGATVQLEHGRTMDLDVAIVVATATDGQTMAVVNVPSSPVAMQLKVLGGRGDEAEVAAVAREVLASFHANTNWLTRGQIVRRRAMRVVIAAAWGLLLAYGVAYSVWLRKRPDAYAHAGFLGVAGVVFLCGAALLSTLPHGASALVPWQPAALGAVILANAAAAAGRWRRAQSRAARVEAGSGGARVDSP
jgi:hypothetical protein